jgi:hypothetical protein
MYLAGTYTSGGGLRFIRSTDGGKAFEQPRVIDRANGIDGRLPVVAAGPNGLVAVMYYVFASDDTPVATVATSTDHGQSFGRPVALATLNFPRSVGDISGRSGPALSVDPRTGNLYAAVTTSNGGQSELDVYASHNEGRSWTRTTVARTSGNGYAQPELAVDATGRVGVFVFEIGSSGAHPVLFVSAPGGALFGRETPLAEPFDPPGGSADAPTWIGDYQAMATASREFHLVWNQTVSGSLQLLATTVAS